MTAITKVNRPAPLKNVAAFATLLEKMVERDPDLPGLAVFFGRSGWGKTQSAVYGANRHRAVYVECGQYSTARTLMISILVELGDPRRTGSIEELKDRAIELMAANPRRPLIVDEAHFIARKRFVDLLREISDKSGAAVVLIGEEELPLLLEQFERVHNRVLEWLSAVPCDAEDFALLAASRCAGIRIAPDLAAAILDQTKGNTRRIVVNLTKVREACQITGKDTVDLAEFGGTAAIVTGNSPAPRRF